MKITEMNLGRKESTKRALKENFEVNLDYDRLDLRTTRSMLQRVTKLISEARTGKQAHGRYENPAYLKLVMMEQALGQHYRDLKIEREIMLENEEVQKSQVLLAAQDMIDSVQKMIVDISKMKVEELPAVVTGINNEIGTNEGSTFEGEVTESLTALEQALTGAKQALTGALGKLTGEDGDEMPADAFGGEEGGEEMPDMGGEEPADDMGDMGDMGGDEEMPELPEMPEEEPEEVGGAGRKLR
jgi:hypothetical protein